MTSDTTDRFRRALSEAIAGAGGIILSAYFVYPLDFVKTRLQLPQSPYTSMTDGFVRIVREEGFLTLYQGVEGELLKGSLQNFIYLFSYDLLKGYAREEKMLVEEGGGRRGGGAGKVTHVRPLLNKTLHCHCHGSNTSGIRYAYRKERASETRERRASLAGEGKVLTGEEEEEVSLEGGKEHRQIVKVVTSTPPLHNNNNTTASATTAAASTAVDSSKAVAEQPQLSILSNLLIGVVAGCFCQLFINPLSVIQTRIMTAAKHAATSSSSPAAVKVNHSILATALTIWREEGFLAFYTGLLPAFILTTNPAIQFLVFDRLKSMLTAILRQHEHTRPINAIESFVIGAIAKITATLATYPYIMAKLRLQYRGPLPAGQQPYKGTMDVIASILRRDGLVGLYAGLRAQLLKSVLGAALMFMMKEKIVEWSQALMKTKAEKEREAAAAAAVADGQSVVRDKKEL